MLTDKVYGNWYFVILYESYSKLGFKRFNEILVWNQSNVGQTTFTLFLGFHHEGIFYFLYTHEGMQYPLKYLAIIILHFSASFFL